MGSEEGFSGKEIDKWSKGVILPAYGTFFFLYATSQHHWGLAEGWGGKVRGTDWMADRNGWLMCLGGWVTGQPHGAPYYWAYSGEGTCEPEQTLEDKKEGPQTSVADCHRTLLESI